MPQRGAAKWKLKRQLPRVNQNETWNEKLRNNNKKSGGGGGEKEKDEQKISNETVCFPNEIFKGRLGCRTRGSERKRFVF